MIPKAELIGLALIFLLGITSANVNPVCLNGSYTQMWVGDQLAAGPWSVRLGEVTPSFALVQSTANSHDLPILSILNWNGSILNNSWVGGWPQTPSQPGPNGTLDYTYIDPASGRQLIIEDCFAAAHFTFNAQYAYIRILKAPSILAGEEPAQGVIYCLPTNQSPGMQTEIDNQSQVNCTCPLGNYQAYPSDYNCTPAGVVAPTNASQNVSNAPVAGGQANSSQSSDTGAAPSRPSPPVIAQLSGSVPNNQANEPSSFQYGLVIGGLAILVVVLGTMLFYSKRQKK